MEHQPKITDYLSILFKWKKLFIIVLLFVTIISTVISFLIPETFKSISRVILAPQNSNGMGGLSSLMSGNSALSLGAELFGSGSTNEDLILGLLNSRTIIEKVVNKYDLYDYYDENERNYDKLIKKMAGDLIFELNEFGMIEVGVINKNPNLAADIANSFVTYTDSINIELGVRAARNNRIFIENRYNKNVQDLRSAEDSLYIFQKKYGIFAIPEQLEISIKAAAEIEAQLNQKEIMLYMLKETGDTSSPQYISLFKEVKLLRNKVDELKNSDKLSSSSNILFPFRNMPNIIIEYFRLFRDVEIQSKILEFTLPMYEQAKLDEQKSTPTVLIIDKAVPAQLKFAPKKAFIILSFFFITFFILLILVLRGEKILTSKNITNAIERKELRFYSYLINLFKINV